jgi:8-oxo-dGTP pyrophosphatase MutT (NUDIX family)
VRQTLQHGGQLLVLSFDHPPRPPFRLPGGNLEPDEDPLAGMARELREETGLVNFTVLRQLGVKHYYKPYIQANVERHDFLLHIPDDLGDNFSFIVQGAGNDAGAHFHYHWIGKDKLALMDREFQHDITPDYLPEIFV